MNNLFTFHNLYVFLYFFVTYISLLTMGYFDMSFKKGRKLLCLSTTGLLLLIPVFILILTNNFATGSEGFPLWFYFSTLVCIIPLIFWAEGNPFLNWLNLIVVGDYSLALLEFPIGMASSMFIKNPQTIIRNFDAASLPLVIPFVIVYIIITFFSLYLRKIWQRIIPKKWLANLMFTLSLLPMGIVGFFNATVINGMLRAYFYLANGILSILSLPVTIIILLLIYYLKEHVVEKKRIQHLKKENQIIFESHKKVTTLIQKTAIWRHDIRNHLEVIENTLSEESSPESTSDSSGKIKEILSNTDAILSESKKFSLQEYTGHPILDSLFSIKAHTAKEQKTDLEYQFSLPNELKITDYDLVTLCSNLMDNALEACLMLTDEDRYIKFFIYEKKGYLCFDIINSFQENPDGIPLFQTTKNNRKEHGYGMKIIKDIAKKYSGYIDFTNNEKDSVRVFAALKL